MCVYIHMVFVFGESINFPLILKAHVFPLMLMCTYLAASCVHCLGLPNTVSNTTVVCLAPRELVNIITVVARQVLQSTFEFRGK